VHAAYHVARGDISRDLIQQALAVAFVRVGDLHIRPFDLRIYTSCAAWSFQPVLCSRIGKLVTLPRARVNWQMQNWQLPTTSRPTGAPIDEGTTGFKFCENNRRLIVSSALSFIRDR
jgi:hypothetical protein